MFHLKYPKKSGFFDWSELGCLSRALGYKLELFKEHITDEIQHSSEGVSLKELIKMMDYKILQRILHQTFNMHTADWNMCVIKKCLLLLNHKALTFEEINTIRIGYETYEAIDMKGMIINKHIILRTVKMCSRMIAPMKLMHRIKHMKDDFEEKGRIQLYEFLDLILWCDLCEYFQPDKEDLGNEKKNKLFTLVDFERLLCHHDERIAGLLNRKFLQEEWGFAEEKLGSKKLFKDPTIHNEDIIRRVVYHKEKYKYLKGDINNSHKEVYEAKAGFVRPRPLTAPHLNQYRRKIDRQTMTERSVSEAYKIVERRLRSAPSRPSRCLPERPKTSQYHREPTPPIITCQEFVDFQNKQECLEFDMATVKTRSEEALYEDMQYLLPGYREKKDSDPKPVVVECVKIVEKKKKDMNGIIEELHHPTSRNPLYHFKSCDARHRGWYGVRHKKGLHKVLINPPYNEGPDGYFTRKLQQQSDNDQPKNYIYRYTKNKTFVPMKGCPKYRPHTAIVSKTYSETTICLKQKTHVKENENVNHMRNSMTKSNDQTITPDSIQEHLGDTTTKSTTSAESSNISNQIESPPKRISPQNLVIESPEKAPIRSPTELNLKFTSVSTFKKPSVCPFDYPTPVMMHTRPKIVEVGHIGRIKLLESIQESQDLEELLEEPPINYIKSHLIESSDPQTNVTETCNKIQCLEPSDLGNQKEDYNSFVHEETLNITECQNTTPFANDTSESVGNIERPETNRIHQIEHEETDLLTEDSKIKNTAWVSLHSLSQNNKTSDKNTITDKNNEAKHCEQNAKKPISCHKVISTKASNRMKSYCYSRLANRVTDPSRYVRKCLLSAGSS